jgi:hypothetical protein
VQSLLVIRPGIGFQIFIASRGLQRDVVYLCWPIHGSALVVRVTFYLSNQNSISVQKIFQINSVLDNDIFLDEAEFWRRAEKASWYLMPLERYLSWKKKQPRFPWCHFFTGRCKIESLLQVCFNEPATKPVKTNVKVSVPVPMRKCENKKVNTHFLKSYSNLLPIKKALTVACQPSFMKPYLN